MDIDTWLERLSAELDISDLEFDDNSMHTLLDLARDAAHEVERMAAPLSTFLVGVAVGRGESLGAASAKATALAMGLDGPAHDGTGQDETGQDETGHNETGQNETGQPNTDSESDGNTDQAD